MWKWCTLKSDINDIKLLFGVNSPTQWDSVFLSPTQTFKNKAGSCDASYLCYKTSIWHQCSDIISLCVSYH
jgi:hypothetical protein